MSKIKLADLFIMLSFTAKSIKGTWCCEQ